MPAAILALIYIPSWQVGRVLSEGASARAVFELENEARRTMAQIVLGVFGLLALFVTWRRTRAAEKAVQVAESGQQTERFTKAIEQLGAADDKGNPRLEIRLGGIYALERLARDSEYQDHWSIMEVLTAYVRENAPFVEAPEEVSDSEGKPRRRTPRIDIQAIVTVLGRRGEVKGESRSLDLSGTDLRGGVLAGLHMEGANLHRVHLEGANLDGVQLDRANLTGAHLERAHLGRAHLEGATLWGADLEGAFLKEAQLEGAILFGAHLEGAHLREAHLERANLFDAHMEGADLDGAHLGGADLASTDVTSKQLERAIGDATTRLPDGMSPPDNWPQ